MTLVSRLAVVIFLGLLQFAAVVVPSGWPVLLLLFSSALAGVFAVPACAALGAPFATRLEAGLWAAGTSVVGLALGTLGVELTALCAMAPVVAASAAALMPLPPLSLSSVCGKCRSPLPTTDLHRCPRCAGYFCGRCFVGPLSRCSLCSNSGIRLLPRDPDFWMANLGSRLTEGCCSLCLRPGDQPVTDLRLCRHCHWPQCTDCWDDQNARCSRCGEAFMDISDQLSRTRYSGGTGSTFSER